MSDIDKTPEELLAELSKKDYPGAEGVQGIRAALDLKLAETISGRLNKLSEVIGASANQIAKGAKFAGESIDHFRSDTLKSNEKLIQSLDDFRKSMDKSSERMSSLTLWLVVFTAVLALTAILQIIRLIFY